MDLEVGDRVRVVSNINIIFIQPADMVINYTLFPLEEYIITAIDDNKNSWFVNNEQNPMGGEISFSDRTKLVKIT